MIIFPIFPQDLHTTASPTFAAVTCTGTVQAEQITSTDDFTMAGLLTNTLSSNIADGIMIDGDTNPSTYSSFSNLNVLKKTINGSGSTALPTLGINFLRQLTWDFDFSGSSFSGYRSKSIYNDGAIFNYTGDITISSSALAITANRVAANFSATAMTGAIVNSAAHAFYHEFSGGYFSSYLTSSINITGGTTTLDIIGGHFNTVASNPTIVAGSPVINYFGGKFVGKGTAGGISTSYGGYFSGTGSDTNYDVYAANSGSTNYFAGPVLCNTTLGVTSLSTLTGGISSGNIEPITDDTYYLGKNDDDTPKAWKGVILKDQTDGKYYRLELNNGSVSIVDLTD